MLTMTVQSILLLVAVFGIFSALGWVFAGKRRKVSRVSVFDSEIIETPTVATSRPAIAHYDVAMAAEKFTSGVVVPFKAETIRTSEPGVAVASDTSANSKSPYAPLEVMSHVDMAALRAAVQRFEPNLQARVSSLASMTPESVEAAVQQAGTGLEPVRLSTPRGAIDDLTVISGVGPGNQQELNELGIFHYWQIAGWTPEHVAWISNRIRFPKRVVRENWMAQAAKLAKLS